MPNIKTYDAPADLALRPTETGVEATAQAANRIGRFFNQSAAGVTETGNQFARSMSSAIKDAGDTAVQYLEHREISHGAATFAQLNDNLTQAWNDTAKGADPNDPATAQKFREGVLEPALDNYREGFITEGGQKFAEGRIAALRNHMFEKTAADMSSLAAKAVEVNVRQTANSLSNTAMRDPSSVAHLLDSADGLVGGMVDSAPNIKGAESARARMELTEKMKEAIVKAGAFGAIQISPDPEATASDWAARYPTYINGQEALTLGRAAKTQARTNTALQKQTDLYQKQIDELNVHKAANDAFSKNVQIDPVTNKPIISPQFFKDSLDIAKKYPNAPNAATVAKTFIDWGESQQRPRSEVITTDPATQKGLLDGVFNPEKPTSQIDVLRAEADHKLSSHDATVLRQLVEAVPQQAKGPVYQSAIDGAKERLGVTTMVDGHERYANFMQTFWPEYMRQKNAGTLPPNALDLKDKNSLISQSLKQFEPSPNERMMAHTIKLLGTNPSSLTAPGTTITGISTEDAAIVRTKADYDKLAPGATYIAPDGQPRRKAR